MPSWDITLASCCGGYEVDLSHSQSRLRLRSPRTLSIFWWFAAVPNTFPRLPLPVWLIPEGRILESYTAGPITESIISVSCCLQYTVHIHSARTVRISLIKMAIFCSLIRERKKATLKPSKSNWLVVHSIFLFLLKRLLRFASFTKYDIVSLLLYSVQLQIFHQVSRDWKETKTTPQLGRLIASCRPLRNSLAWY